MNALRVTHELFSRLNASIVVVAVVLERLLAVYIYIYSHFIQKEKRECTRNHWGRFWSHMMRLWISITGCSFLLCPI